LADRKHTAHKAILEGFRFDKESGEIIWAIDKAMTGKAAYRIKMRRRFMETDLVMFGCKVTTLFALLEPRTFSYLTKIKLIDGRSEATPLRYWWSRIDTRSSTIANIFLEPITSFKLTLSDTVHKVDKTYDQSQYNQKCNDPFVDVHKRKKQTLQTVREWNEKSYIKEHPEKNVLLCLLHIIVDTACQSPGGS
ncbi:unnamed protein product, partial [marine sediment metagenome]